MKYGNGNLVISGWDIISPMGIGRDEFTENFKSRRIGNQRMNDSFSGVKLDQAYVAENFNVNSLLGKRGTRTFDRTTQLTICTAKLALEHRGISENERLKTGIVLGSTNGSLKSITDFSRDTFTQEKPYFVNPSLFPNVVLNCAASQCAIWHKLRGPNATVSSGSMSGLSSIQYAMRLLKNGYADLVLAGGVEEYCKQSAWAFQKSLPKRIRGKECFGEGCVFFALETKESAEAKNRAFYAEIIACECRLIPRIKYNFNQFSEHLADCIAHVLEISRVEPRDVAAVSKYSCTSRKIKEVETEALQKIFRKQNYLEQFAISDLSGNAMSAAVSFQVAAALTYTSEKHGNDNTYILITTLSIDGYVGCMLLQTKGSRGRINS